MTSEISHKTPNAEAVIQQINLGYNVQQDRLLFRVGLSDDTELLLWITYRIARQLWQLLSGETHLPTADSIQSDLLAAKAVEQFKLEAQTAEALKKMDFATQYQPRKEIRNEGALLAVGLKLSGESIKHLDIACLEGVTVGINLPPALVLALCNMLQLSAKESGWQFGSKLPTQPLVNSEAAVLESNEKNKVVH